LFDLIWIMILIGWNIRRLTSDRMTDLYRRDILELLVPQFIEKLSRDGGKVTVVFFDIDGLKEINDSLGHKAGDELIIKFASVLRSSARLPSTRSGLPFSGRNLRQPDLLSHWGGDEFVAVINGNESSAIAFAERVASGAEKVGISFSYGAIEISNGDFYRALDLADKAMYRQKNAKKA